MKYSLLFMIIPMMFACKQEMSEADREEGLRDFKSQEVKRVSKAEIYAAGLEQGREIALAAQSALVSHLTSTISEKGAVAALSFCNVDAYPIVDSLSKIYNATIKRTSFRYRNPDDAPDELEIQLLDAYEFNIEEGNELKENIQEFDEKYLIYTKPIIAGAMCLECHGKNVSESMRNQLKVLYPGDKALNHELNDLRGMWSVKIPVKDIVNGLE